MDPSTYRLSHLYLSRYRTLRVIRDIATSDKNSEGPTPQKSRTPRWFAAMHLRRFEHLEEDIPAVHLSSDSDSDEEDDDRMRLIRPELLRPLYHNSLEEVLILFAKHIQWLLQDQRQRRRNYRYFDVDVWQKWANMIRRGDEGAMLAHLTDDEEEEEVAIDEEQQGPAIEDDDQHDQEMQLDGPGPDLWQEDSDELADYEEEEEEEPQPLNAPGSAVLGKRKASPVRGFLSLIVCIHMLMLHIARSKLHLRLLSRKYKCSARKPSIFP